MIEKCLESTASSHVSSRPASNSYQLAVVGCGPRGLYCLDSLANELQQLDQIPRLYVTVIEPCQYPGAGCTYDIRQPHHLRMNFAARHIDAWVNREDRTLQQLSLVEWMRLHHPGFADPNAFVPRAIVGEYLHHCFRLVAERLSRFAEVSLIRDKVDEIKRTEDHWRVSLSSQTLQANEVLLTIGHEGWRTTAMQEEISSERLIEGVFPICKQLNLQQVAPQAKVALRGFGLTAIDAALSLTEGRGGKFHECGNELQYEPGGWEPEIIYPYSRTGRPMLAKPSSPTLIDTVDTAIWDKWRTEILNSDLPISPSRFDACLWQPVIRAASEALTDIKGSIHSVTEVTQWFENWRLLPPEMVTNVMRQSAEIALGNRQPDAAWAIGEAWRQLYPALVKTISHGGLTNNGWTQFKLLAVEMERIAFGPSEENVRKILALIDHGMIDLTFLAQPSLTEHNGIMKISNDSITVNLDKCINAVIASPNTPATTGPIGSLLSRGSIKCIDPTLGIDIDRAGRPISEIPGDTAGLAILGRATEGCVLGNDTLSRKLHEHDRFWASGVIKRLLMIQS